MTNPALVLYGAMQALQAEALAPAIRAEDGLAAAVSLLDRFF